MAGPREPELPDGTQAQPILVYEDQDAPQSGIGREVEQLVRQVRKGDARFDPIDLDGEDDSLSEDPWRADEDSYDNDNAKIEQEELANEPEDTQDRPCLHWKKGIRNPCLCGTHQKVSKATIGCMDLGESQVVELKEPVRVGRYCAEFVEIHEIWVPNKGDQVLIRGRTYARTRNLEGRIEPRKNEVSEIYELDENDHRAADPRRYLEQALVEIPVQDVKTTRTLHKTNKAFPECRFDRVRYRTKAERENEAPLTCRWQMVLSYPDPRYRRQQRPIAGEVIRHYDQDDISKDRHRVPDSERRKAHEKIRGGSFIPNGAPEARPKASPIHLAPGQKYTVVDIFSGAGGYSKGAEMAGLKILAACDHWPRCCETYRQNFPDTELHQEDVYKFIEDMSTDLTRERLNVDILHFSPPCQTWSPAHTCEGKKDEENRATLFACEKIITIFKPRIFTVEQTFGLAQDRWIPNFNALLQGFTRHGYSVRWKVLHLVEYGLPQTRKRLVMFGAAPGEQIPDWPKPTHSKDPSAGQKPFVSAFKACSTLVEGEILHDVEGARPTNKAPWDSSKPLGRTITTSGGQSYHPSGLRDLTLRELAVFQGFPSTFVFIGKCIKKQIGNAFAPIVVKTLLKCIRVHLESFDGVTHQPPPGQINIVSDDDDDDNDHQNKRPQLHNNDQCQTQIESPVVVEDLVGFGRKPSGLSQELLQGMIEGFRKNSVQCFLAKENQKSSKRSSSSGPSLQRSSRVSSRQCQPTQRNTIDSYFVPDNNQDSPTDGTAVAGDDINAPPQTAANPDPDPGLTTPEDTNAADQDVTAGTSSAPFQIPSTPDKGTGAQISNAVHQTISRTINAGTISALPRQKPSELDASPARRSAESAVTVAHLGPAVHHTHSGTTHSTAARSSGQTIVGGILNTPTRHPADRNTDLPMARQSSAPSWDPSESDTDMAMAHQSEYSSDLETDMPRARPSSAPTAQTIANLNYSPPQTRSASLRSTGHHGAENAQNIAGLGEPYSTGHSSSSYAAASQPAPTGRIINGVLTAPRRPSPPGFWDTTPSNQVPRTSDDENSSYIGNAAPFPAPRTLGQAVARVSAAAEGNMAFPSPAEEVECPQVDEDATPRQAFNADEAFAGVLEVAHDSRTYAGLADAFRAEGINEGTDTPRPQRHAVSRDDTPRREDPTPQSGHFEGSSSSSARQTGIHAAARNDPQGIQTGDGAPGPSRPRSSGGSVAYLGESSRAGARRSLAIDVEDDQEEEGVGSGGRGGSYDGGAQNDGSANEVEDDNDPQLQRALWMSRAGAPSIQGAPSLQDAADELRRPGDRTERALTFQRMMLERNRLPSQDNVAEGVHGAVGDDAPAPGVDPEHERKYGPGDPQGKGKAVAKRALDEDKEEMNPKKRPRGGK